MDATLLARIGLNRLRLPIPTAKLVTIHGIADALEDEECQQEIWDELVRWISKLELESLVAEALCIPILARKSSIISVAKLQAAIGMPSPLSDLLLAEISGRALLINAWAKAHSGEAPPLFSDTNIVDDLKAGYIVPGILSTRIELLEKKSGKPFLRQWAYEFSRLSSKTERLSDGHWEYFIDKDRDRATGQFVMRRGHIARSAYLRTLSMAFDQWNMPEEIAYYEARFATPADLSFLKMLPGPRPPSTDVLYGATPSSVDEWQEALLSVVHRFTEDAPSHCLLHLNTPVTISEKYKAEVELITCLQDDEFLSPEEMMKLHRFLPGQVQLPRSRNWGFIIGERSINDLTDFFVFEGVRMLSGLLPCVAQFVGYLQFDLVGRMPYLPANYTSAVQLIGTPRKGGMDLSLGENQIGEFRYWNYNWSPTHDKALDASCGICLTLSTDACNKLWAVDGMKLGYYWKATVLTRENDYGPWDEKIEYGSLPGPFLHEA